jgi:DUF971 family protein
MRPLRALRLLERERVLELAWEEGRPARLPYRLLREQCPCAACRQSRRAGPPARIDPAVRLAAVEPYGTNAVHIAFSDGHARGIFPFPYLEDLARMHDTAAAG